MSSLQTQTDKVNQGLWYREVSCDLSTRTEGALIQTTFYSGKNHSIGSRAATGVSQYADSRKLFQNTEFGGYADVNTDTRTNMVIEIAVEI